MTEPLTLTVPEAGHLLGISRTTAYKLVAAGKLPVLRLGRKIVVPRYLLMEMLEGARLDTAHTDQHLENGV
jgi:excisionase family DNA binding protein